MEKRVTLILVVLLFLTRILFNDTNIFLLDGDEAIVGLMALDLLEGNFPLYFYGQQYGLSIIEAASIAIWILLFGVSYASIKIPMIVLFGIGFFFISKTIFSFFPKKDFHIVILLLISFIVSPTWLIWSMKARGGYLTSFFFSSFLSYSLLTNNKYSNSKWFGIAIGLLLSLIFESQPLWLPPLIPLVIFYYYEKNYNKKFKIIYSILPVISFSISIVFFHLFKQTLSSTWNTPTPNPLSRLFEIESLLSMLLNNLGGNYFLSNTYDPKNTLFSIVFLFFIVFATAIYFFNLKKLKNKRSHFLLISMIFSLSGYLFSAAPRYLLPFFGFSIIFLSDIISQSDFKLGKRLIAICLGFLLIIGSISTYNLRFFSFNNMNITSVDPIYKNDIKIFDQLIRILKSENIKYVFSTNELLQYQLTFLTNKTIISTSNFERSRTPWNYNLVFDDFEKNKNDFAVIGFNFYNRFNGQLPLIQDKIFYIIRPNDNLIQQLGLK